MVAGARMLIPALAVLLASPAAVGAQAPDPELQAIEALVREGESDAARAQLDSWFQSSAGSADARSRELALWLRGRLTLDPTAAVQDYRALVQDYPDGPFANPARLRLALAADATGDPDLAEEWMRSVLSSSPDSAAASAARSWLEARTPAAAPASGPAEEAPQALEPGGRFSVQIGAYLSRARARRMVERTGARGFEARIVTVPGSPLFRVRIGRFTARADAVALAGRVGAAGFATYVSDDVEQEEPIG